MTNKFAVYTDSFEFAPSQFPSIECAYLALDDRDNKLVALCDTLEEAQAVLATLQVSTRRYSHSLAYAEVAFIEEGAYEQDEDGEWEFVMGSNIYDFKADR